MRFALLLIATLAGGCAARKPASAPEAPPPSSTAERSSPSAKATKVRFEEHTVATKLGKMRVRLYAPEPMPDSPGLVVVPPAGSNLVTGMDLGDGDRPEQEPYAKAGYVVAAFEIAGAIPPDPTTIQLSLGMVAFLHSHAGLDNASAALDDALQTFPAIDPARIYAAGHSSAGTLALLFAATEPRVTAVAAFAPVTDVVGFLPPEVVDGMNNAVPGYRDFLVESSPITHADALAAKPVLLFHAADDTVVDPAETKALFDAMPEHDPRSRRLVVETGGHYGAMITEGIPAAITWFDQLSSHR